jgi:16S rRNA (cytosine967-C5)-methyltransferase
VKATRGLIGHAEQALARMLAFDGPADQILSVYFRRNPILGKADRAFIAESCYAVLRRRRSLEAAAGSDTPRALIAAALLRVLGYSARTLEPLLNPGEVAGLAQVKAWRVEDAPAAVRVDLPDWFWDRLVAEKGAVRAEALARSLLRTAPLDLRVNLARISREEVLERLTSEGLAGEPTPYSPAGIRLQGKPDIHRTALFREGLVEVQDEGSQLLAWLVAPRRGEWIADFCAGAGGKTLAMAALMRGSGRIYAMDVSAARLRDMGPRASRAGVSNIHPMAIASEADVRLRRLAGKLDRVLVDAPCSGFGTLRRNPDLKWRLGAEAITELSAKQARILAAAARLVKPGGRLVYATCSVLRAENEDVTGHFAERHPEFRAVQAAAAGIPLLRDNEASTNFYISPNREKTDGFFAVVFERLPALQEEEGMQRKAAGSPR